MNEAPANLGQRLVSGIAWVVAFRILVRCIGLVSTMILARLLVPADFGLVALATLMVATVELLTAFNFTTWLIRHPDPQPKHYDTVWTLTIIRGVVTCLVFVVFSEQVAALFDEPRLADVLKILGLGSLLTGCINVGIIDFQRELNFHREFLFRAYAKVGAFVVSIAGALIFRSYWALIGGIVVNNLLLMLLSFRMHNYRPSIGFRSWREIYDFSKWLLVGNLLGFLYVSVDTLIIGKIMGSQGLGLYSVARNLANLTWTEIVSPIRRVLLPGYATMNDNRERLRKGFLDGFAIIVLFGTPCALGIGLTADPLVRVILGEQWTEAIPIVQALSLYAFSAIVMSNQSPILMVLGRTRLLAGLYALGLVILIPTFLFGLDRYGLAGAALGLGIANSAAFLIILVITLRLMEISLSQALSQVWRAFAAAAVMAAVVILFQQQAFVADLWPVFQLLLEAGVGALTFIATLLLLWRLCGMEEGPERTVMEYVMQSRLMRRGRVAHCGDGGV